MAGKWMQGVKKEMKRKGTEGSFSRAAKAHGMSTSAYAHEKAHSPGLVGKRARLALAFASARKKK
jgi:hypothetical protein